MMPTTALALLLIGGAGAAHRRSDRGVLSKTLFGLATVVVLAVALGTLAEYGLGMELPVDQVLPPGQSTLSGRPSPLTALALTCLAAALLFSNARADARLYPSEWLVLCAALVALTGLTGIILGAAPLYRLTRTPIIGLSLPTAVSLLLTSMGVLLARPTTGFMRVATSPGPGGMLLRRVALPTIVVPILLSLVVTRFSAAQGIVDARVPVAILVVMMAVVSLSLLRRRSSAPEPCAPGHRGESHPDPEPRRAGARGDIRGEYRRPLHRRERRRLPDAPVLACRDCRGAPSSICCRQRISSGCGKSRELLLEGTIQVGEWRLRRKDGSFVPVEVSARILPDGRWQGFVRDITERKRIESEQRFQAEVGSALAATLDYEETLSRIADIATRGLADFCVIDLLDDGDEVRRRRVANRDPSKVWICDSLQRTPFDRGRPS